MFVAETQCLCCRDTVCLCCRDTVCLQQRRARSTGRPALPACSEIRCGPGGSGGLGLEGLDLRGSLLEEMGAFNRFGGVVLRQGLTLRSVWESKGLEGLDLNNQHVQARSS